MLVICISGTKDQIYRDLKKGSRFNVAYEFRLDLMPAVTEKCLKQLVKMAKGPVIFTLRDTNNGGEFHGSQTEKNIILNKLQKLKPDFIDLDYNSTFFDKVEKGIKVICSYHNFLNTPLNISDILGDMKKKKADIYKIATKACSSLDVFRLFDLHRSEKSLTCIGMGEKGEFSRIIGPIIGNRLNYTFFERNIAPGQLPFNILYENYKILKLNQSTKIFCLIGNPIRQSIGHLFHNNLNDKLSLNAVYIKINLEKYELESFFKAISSYPIFGISVTMPFKQTVLPFVTKLNDDTKKIGATNTLIKSPCGWEAINTDGVAAIQCIKVKKNIRNLSILIVGSGGVGRAIAYEAIKEGALVTITNRTEKKALELCKHFQCKSIRINEIPSHNFDLIINSTSLSMNKDQKDSKRVFSNLSVNYGGLDLVYNCKNYFFIDTLKNKNLFAVNGIEIFKQQAILQVMRWSLFTDMKRLEKISNTF